MLSKFDEMPRALAQRSWLQTKRKALVKCWRQSVFQRLIHNFLFYCQLQNKYKKDIWLSRNRSNHQRCSVRKGVLRNFTKFAGKHLCQSLFFKNDLFNPFQSSVTFLYPLKTSENLWFSDVFRGVQKCDTGLKWVKIETLAQVFSCEFCKISKNTFFTEHLLVTASFVNTSGKHTNSYLRQTL